VSFGRLLRGLQSRGRLSWNSWLDPNQHSEKTPVGALFLHFVGSLLMILATYGMDPDKAYNLLTFLSTYVVQCFNGTLLGIGILLLRLVGPPRTPVVDEGKRNHGVATSPPPSWRQITGKYFNPTLSVVAATAFTAGSLFPLVANWLATTTRDSDHSWYIKPMISWTIIAFGVLWYLGFLAVAGYTGWKHHTTLTVEKKYEFDYADSGAKSPEDSSCGSCGSDLIIVKETVYMTWVGRETLREEKNASETWHARSSSAIATSSIS
jgi:hypothetical protein